MFARVVLPLLALGLLIYALVDIAGTEKKDLGGLPKWFWIVVVIFLPVLGPLVWIVFRISRRQSAQSYPGPSWGASGRPGNSGRRASGPVAPDDDPDFLWRLDQERRRQQRSGGTSGPAADGTATNGTPTNGDVTGNDAGSDGDGNQA